MFEIIILQKRYLKQSIRLVKRVFSDEVESVKAELKASIDNEEFIKYKKKVDRHTKTLEYFVAVNEEHKVLGIVGLYSLYENYEDTYWLGWYCVNKKSRGLGVGIALLKYAMDEAKKRGKKYLSLYTSTDKNELKAQSIYERNGFYITKRIKEDGYEILYRTKDLTI